MQRLIRAPSLLESTSKLFICACRPVKVITDQNLQINRAYCSSAQKRTSSERQIQCDYRRQSDNLLFISVLDIYIGDFRKISIDFSVFSCLQKQLYSFSRLPYIYGFDVI